MPTNPRSARAALCLAAALSASACSTRPRNFSATVTPAPAAQLAPRTETAAFADCNTLVRSGHKGNFAAAAASGAAGGVAVFGSAAAVAASGTVGMATSSAGYALSAAIPFVGLAAGFGMNRMIRAGRERKYKRTMTSCMQELGYDVVDWTKAPKKQPATAILRPAAPAPEPAPVPEPVPAAPETVATAS